MINILLGLLRMKAAAVLLGPAGVGLIGLFQNLVTAAATLSALGFGTVGVRQIAAANADGRSGDIAVARRALFWGTLVLASVGGVGFFLLRDLVAVQIVADPLRASEIGWLSLGIALTVAAGSQSALLGGLRRIGDIARLQILSGILATLIGVSALLVWREKGLIVFVLATPLASFLLGHWYVSRIGRILEHETPLVKLAKEWKAMARLGAPFMVSGVVLAVAYLTVRGLIHGGAGPEALGQFQAAWQISVTYLGFVLGAMATDYYPRLTGAIRDPGAAVRLVNEQTEVALLLASPVLLALLALAPLVIHLLYSAEFDLAADILRWQIMGDFLKVASWPLGFVLLAAGAGKTFLSTECIGIGVFVLGVWVGLPLAGVEAAGIGFACMYVIYLPLVYALARRLIGFRWTQRVVRHMWMLGFSLALVAVMARVSGGLAVALGLTAGLGFGVYGLGRLGEMTYLPEPLGRAASLCRHLTGRLRFSRR